MNFDTSSPWNMPELHWAYGYPAALGLMAVIGGGLLYYFARKGWLS
jgi:magnesium transporter